MKQKYEIGEKVIVINNNSGVYFGIGERSTGIIYKYQKGTKKLARGYFVTIKHWRTPFMEENHYIETTLFFKEEHLVRM